MIGIDEVGRGAWAGPLLVVAARQCRDLPSEVDDSKVLSRRKREDLIAAITAVCDVGEGWVSSNEVDTYGLTNAMKLGVERALKAVGARPDEEIIMDGHINYCAPNFVNVQAIIDADATHAIVSAASIYAKVTRDAHMTKLAVEFPNYGFEAHVGYGTKRHSEALASLGVCIHHRRSYKPIKRYL